jgi:hypothetical protein
MGIALSGRGRRSVRPPRLGRRKAAPGHRGTGKNNSRYAVTKRNPAAEPAGQKTLHEVEEEG